MDAINNLVNNLKQEVHRFNEPIISNLEYGLKELKKEHVRVKNLHGADIEFLKDAVNNLKTDVNTKVSLT